MTNAVVLTPPDIRLLLSQMLEREEGLRLTVYDDATGKAIVPGTLVVGHPSIGIGRALDVRGISTGEADFLLENDINEVLAQVREELPYFDGLSARRQVVLLAMAFQMGIGGLLGFRNTLAMVKAGDYSGAATGMLNSRWAKQTPARARRMSDIMRDG
jgi:lysozyme